VRKPRFRYPPLPRTKKKKPSLKNPAFGPTPTVSGWGPIFKNGCKARFPLGNRPGRLCRRQDTVKTANRKPGRPPGPYFFLCLFFRSFFLRLWVAILRNLRFLPQGTSASPYKKYIHFPGPSPGRQESLSSLRQGRKKVNTVAPKSRLSDREYHFIGPYRFF
jgi:hypothetical protein